MSVSENSPNNQHRESLMDLIRGIVQDARNLSSKEFTAAKLEIREEIKTAIGSSVVLVAGIFLAAIGFVFLSIVAALVLVRYLLWPLWVAFAAVGSLYCLVGAVAAMVGSRKLKTANPIPQNTLRSTKEDARYIRHKAAGH